MVPVIIGEYGPSTTGALPDDANGTEVVLAAQASRYGCLAWTWQDGNTDLLLNGTILTTYGQEVAAYIAGQSTSGFATISP
jgi:hypothetical protein